MMSMALANSDDGDLPDFFCSSRAATPSFRDQDELTDNISAISQEKFENVIISTLVLKS